MKLYVWDLGEGSFQTTLVIVLAESEEQAREIAKTTAIENRWGENLGYYGGKEDLTVYEASTGILVKGADYCE